MSARPRVLDLFCGPGGASMGYHLAGFDVTGVDIQPQPHYPFRFVQADALDYPLDGYDAIHASPGCQHHSKATAWRGAWAEHPDQLTPTLAHLAAEARVPYIVENVTRAQPAGGWDVILCGSMFGLPVRRHRGFRAPWLPYELLPPHGHKRTDLRFGHKHERAYADAMGCRWMGCHAARQAIPPAYTQYLGERLLAALGHTAKAAA